MPVLAVVGCVVAIVWSLAGGLAFRAGRLKRMGQWYFESALPAIIRNTPLQLIPIGLFLTAILTAALLAPEEGEEAGAAGLTAFFAAFILLALWIFVMVRPPKFLKPAWIRARESTSIVEGRGWLSKKALENLGFAFGGFAVAMLLLWGGLIGAEMFHGSVGALVIGVSLALLSVAAFVASARRQG